MLTLGACDRDPVAPGTAPGAAPETGPTPAQLTSFDGVIRELPPRLRFDVTIEVDEPFGLEEPVGITARSRANLASDEVEVRIHLPELALAREQGGRLDHVPVGVRQPAELTRSGGLARGAERADRVEVSIPWAGYWRVSVAVQGPETPHFDETGRPLLNFVSREAWLYVDENGGTVTEAFDETLFPDTLMARPGPFVRKPRRKIRGPVDTVAGPATAPALVVMQTSTFTLKWWNSESAQYQPAVNVPLDGEFLDDQDERVGAQITQTDIQGSFQLDCNSEYYFFGQLHWSHQGFFFDSIPALFIEYQGCDPGWDDPSDIVVPSSDVGRMWSAMVSNVPNYRTLFNQTRSAVEVRVLSSGCDRSFYNRPGDFILLCGLTITTNSRSHEVAPHEFGHALHEKGFGGINGSGPGGGCGENGHFLLSAHTMACAFVEGIADFVGAIISADSLNSSVGSLELGIEDPHLAKGGAFGVPEGKWCDDVKSPCSSSEQTEDASRAEAALGGFLYDLADNASTTNLDPGVDDDPVSYGAAYVGDVIEACEVREFGQWIRANGLDHLIYCFERRLSTYAAQGFFPTRPIDPTDWSAPVTLPSGWNANTIKTVWQDVAYPLGAPVAPLTADIAGPSQVRPFDFCSWQSVVSGGAPPYQYQWSGVLSGTSSFVTESLSSSGTFWLEVTSSDQQQVTTSFPITVSSGAQECTF